MKRIQLINEQYSVNFECFVNECNIVNEYRSP